MIPTIIKPADDEMFSTWMDYILKLNGAESPKEQANFLHDLSGTFSSNKVRDYRHALYFPGSEELCEIEQTSSLFPKLEEILKSHTDLYAMMPFRSKGETARRFEFCLHASVNNGLISGKYLKDREIKICPDCLKEDMAKYGREIVHVPHQLYTNVCWKHGCVLQYADTGEPVKEESTDQDMEKAVFMHDLYENPVTSHFEQLHIAVMKSFNDMNLSLKRGFAYLADQGYVKAEHAKQSYLFKKEPSIKEGFCESYIGATVYLYQDTDGLRSVLGQWDPASECDSNEFKTISSTGVGVLSKFQCSKCGHVFYMHPVAVAYGTPCPKCLSTMSRAEVYQRYADRLDDGAYDVYEEDGKIHVIHLECGLDKFKGFGIQVWDHAGCGTCRKKHEMGKRIGEKNRNHKGELMEIIAYRNGSDLDVRFETGEIVTRTNYTAFQFGRIQHGEITGEGKVIDAGELLSGRKTRHLGEENVNNQGYKMTITEYNTSLDITVQFETGDIVNREQYDRFKQGAIRCPSAFRLKRVGEKNLNSEGIEMEIIDYTNADDITVRFSTGDVLEHRKYHQFKYGLIKCPSAREVKHVGERKINYQGYEMEITGYRKYSDIDVRFETGEIVKNKNYQRFKEGYIACPSARFNKHVGEKKLNNQGLTMEIITYRNCEDIDVKFETGEVVTGKSYGRFSKGQIACPSGIRWKRIGEKRMNYQGIKMEIVEYRGFNDIDVKFETGKTVTTTYYSFKNGKTRCPK